MTAFQMTLSNAAHASTHLPIVTALKDMVIELLLDMAAIALFSL